MAAGSKELLPVPDLDTTNTTDTPADIPVCEYLLRQYRHAGIRDIVVIRRSEKTDTGDFFASKACQADFTVTDLITAPTRGSVHSLALGCAVVPDQTVAIGFPDIILMPTTLCHDALAALENSGADVCLGAVPVPAKERWIWDFCVFDEVTGNNPMPGRVKRILRKPETTDLVYAWVLAVCRPVFSRFLIDFVNDLKSTSQIDGEVSLTHVLQAGIDAGLHIIGFNAEQGFALDIGKPERLELARGLDHQIRSE
jgi:dTDP-glucose pyrophosphorylase